MIKYISRYFSNAKLNQKIRFIFNGIIVGYFILFLSLYFFYYSREIKIYSQINDKSIAETAINTLISENKNVNNVTKVITTDDMIRQYLKTEEQLNNGISNSALDSLNQYIYLLDYISSIYVVRLDGEYISAVTNRTAVDKERIAEASWREELESVNGSSIYKKNGNGAFERYSGTDTISYMRAIYDIDNLQLIGYLSVNMNMDFFESACTNLLDSNETGVSFWSEDEQLAGFGRQVLTSLTEEKKDGYSGVFKHERENYSLFCSEIADWNLYFLMERKIVFSSYKKSMLLMLIGITLVFSIMAWVILHRVIVSKITKPIAELVASMDKVKKGWLYRVSMKTDNDEIGSLKDSYNIMLVEMNKLITNIVDKEEEKQRLELEVLQEQIKPHFLYNTLYTIENMANENNDIEVVESLQTLGDFYRKFLSKGEKYITLKEEVQIVQGYMKLQLLRYENAFSFTTDIETGLENYRVPKLILQPLVENSIYHGVRLKGDGGVISVSAKKAGQQVWIHIYDDGVGIDPETIGEILQKKEGKSFGLKATIERLQYFYNVQEVYEIRSEEGEYMEVILKLPLQGEGWNYE